MRVNQAKKVANKSSVQHHLSWTNACRTYFLHKMAVVSHLLVAAENRGKETTISSWAPEWQFKLYLTLTNETFSISGLAVSQNYQEATAAYL